MNNFYFLFFVFRQMAEADLLAPLLRLALVPHTLNYIAFRTLLLFTFTGAPHAEPLVFNLFLCWCRTR
jgi:hypothetical protein